MPLTHNPLNPTDDICTQEDDFNRLRASGATTTFAPSSTASCGSGGGGEGLSLTRTVAGQQQRAQRAQQQARRFTSAAADKLRYSEQERKTKKWLDARIREVAKREEAAERLAAEYQRRMALLKTKEDLEQVGVWLVLVCFCL
jgi:hypothetical protein